MLDAGLIVIVALISPFTRERELARRLVNEAEFFENLRRCPTRTCRATGPERAHKKARRGEPPNFTGIDSPYEPPGDPALRIDTAALAPEASAAAVIALLEQRGVLAD